MPACVLVKHWGANDSVAMIHVTQIEDEETLGQWLAGRPHSDACTIAARIALRLLPFVTNDIDMLQCLRSLLSANVWDGIPASRRRFAQVRFGTGPAGRIIVPGDGANKRRLSLAVTDIAGAALRAVYEPAMSPKFCIFAAENSLHVCSLYAATRTDNSASGAGLAAALNNVVWYEIIADARALDNSAEPLEPIELWMLRSNAVFAGLAKEMEDGWVSDSNVWSFWHRWWRGAVSGQWLDWNLQREVALIPDDIWQQGPKAVAAAIAEIEARRAARHDLHEELAKLPRPTQQVVVAVQQAMQSNRDALPPTFDAIQGLIALEIERLLKRNYTDDLDQQECQRQISVYLALYDSVCALRDNLPTAGPVTLEQAATSEGLLQLYWNKIKQLPREKADEVVEGIWSAGSNLFKVGLIGTSTVLAMSYGIRSDVAGAMAGLVFAPKNVGDLINAARGLASKP